MKTDQDLSHLKLEVGRYSHDGTAHVNADHPEKAIECFYTAYQKARQSDSDQTERVCAFNLGAAYIACGKHSEGIQFLFKATPPDGTKDGRSHGDLYYNMGYGYNGMQDIKSALKYYRLAYEEYHNERDNFEMEIESLSKLLEIYQNENKFSDAAEVYRLMADVHETKNDTLILASCLCEMASNLRLNGQTDVAEKAADDCMKLMGNQDAAPPTGLKAGKVYNDLGILYTQLQKYDNAVTCFEQGLPLVQGQSENSQLGAVLSQNLGAAYNYVGDYVRSIQFHKTASEKYAKLKNRSAQGQCFFNLAFAYNKLEQTENAEVSFHHSLQAARDTGDVTAVWQSLEGLAAIKYIQGHYRQALDFLFEAHSCVGQQDSLVAERLRKKIFKCMKPGSSPIQYSTGHPGFERVQSQQSTYREAVVSSESPRSGAGSQLQAEALQAGQQPMMSQIQQADMVAQQQQEQLQQQQQRGPRVLPMRKKDSFAPHLPKVARGFSGSTSSPRYKNMEQNIKEETSSGSSDSETGTEDSDSSSGSESESETESESEQTERKVARAPQEKSPIVEEIFRPASSATMNSSRPGSRLVPAMRGDLQADHKLYEQMLLEKEENEGSDDKDNKSSSSDESGSSDDSDSDSEEDSDAEEKKEAETKAPRIPTQSPPNTFDPNMATYLDPVHRTSPFGIHGNQSDSSHRQAADSDTVPYSTVDFTMKASRKGTTEENPYYSLQFERENTGTEPQGIDSMPRATRDTVLYNEHQRHLADEAPPLPPRPDQESDKQSKTCCVM